jgi:hypothetical protein
MDDSDNRRLNAFTRTRRYGEEHAAEHAPNSLGRELFNTLAGIIDELEGHASKQVTGVTNARHGTSNRTLARGSLRELMVAIKRTASALAQDVPNLEAKFRLPRPGSDLRLLSVARAFATEAAVYATQFTTYALPADFLTDFNNRINALAEAIDDQGSGQNNHVAAAAAIDDAIDRGVAVMRKLDALMKNKYAIQPAQLAEWASASHTERAPRARVAAPPSPPAPSPPAP